MCRAAVITGGPEFGEFLPTFKKLNRRVHAASYQLDVLSVVPVVDDIDGLDGSEHDQKKVSMKRSSTAGGTDVQKNCKLRMEK
jgi:hypothetical protein